MSNADYCRKYRITVGDVVRIMIDGKAKDYEITAIGKWNVWGMAFDAGKPAPSGEYDYEPKIHYDLYGACLLGRADELRAKAIDTVALARERIGRWYLEPKHPLLLAALDVVDAAKKWQKICETIFIEQWIKAKSIGLCAENIINALNAFDTVVQNMEKQNEEESS